MLHIGRIIKHLREKQNLSQSDLAQRTLLNRATISLHEYGAQGISIDSLVKYGEALNIPAWRILKYAQLNNE